MATFKLSQLTIPAPKWWVEGTGQQLNEYELRCAQMLVKHGKLKPFNVVCHQGQVSRMREDGIFMDELPGWVISPDCPLGKVIMEIDPADRLREVDFGTNSHFVFETL